MKARAESTYKQCLPLMEQLIGEGRTDGDALEQQGRWLLGSNFKGVFPSDRIPGINKGECCIVNVDKREDPGSHWLALTDCLVYDSFGRKHKDLIPHADLRHSDTALDAEQIPAEENCGARTLAFLCCYMLHGNKGAAHI